MGQVTITTEEYLAFLKAKQAIDGHDLDKPYMSVEEWTNGFSRSDLRRIKVFNYDAALKELIDINEALISSLNEKSDIIHDLSKPIPSEIRQTKLKGFWKTLFNL